MWCGNCKKMIAMEQMRRVVGKSNYHFASADCVADTVPGSKILELRKRKNVSVKSLASKTKLDPSFIYRLEKGIITESRFKSLSEVINKMANKSTNPKAAAGLELKNKRLAAGIKRTVMCEKLGMNYAKYESYERGLCKMPPGLSAKVDRIIAGGTAKVDFSPVVCISKKELDKLQEGHNNWVAIRKLLKQS